jgi:hypothetical protein
MILLSPCFQPPCATTMRRRVWGVRSLQRHILLKCITLIKDLYILVEILIKMLLSVASAPPPVFYRPDLLPISWCFATHLFGGPTQGAADGLNEWLSDWFLLDGFIAGLTGSRSHSFTDWLPDWLPDLLLDWLHDWLTADWLAGSLADWLPDYLLTDRLPIVWLLTDCLLSAASLSNYLSLTDYWLAAV